MLVFLVIKKFNCELNIYSNKTNNYYKMYLLKFNQYFSLLSYVLCFHSSSNASKFHLGFQPNENSSK